MRRTRSRGVAAALAGAAALVTTAFLLAGPGGPEATAADELAACARESPEQRRACFAGVFAREAKAGNVAPTLAELEDLVHRGALDDCHLLAHTLAHAAVSVLGVDRAFLLAADQCRMGYIHGAAELADPRVEARSAPPGAIAGARCARFDQRDLAASCSHGYGHALLRSSPASLQRSADRCASAERFGIHVLPCEAGVMMQHSLAHSRLPMPAYRRATARGCATLAAQRLRTRCFRNVGVVAAFVLAHDPRRTSAVCRGLRAPRARTDCRAGATKEIDEARA